MTIRELFGEEIDEIVKKEPNTIKPSQDEITQMDKTALRRSCAIAPDFANFVRKIILIVLRFCSFSKEKEAKRKVK